MNRTDLYNKIIQGNEKIITIVEIEQHLLKKRIKLEAEVKKLEAKL